MNLIYLIKPPCRKCPYTLGQVRTLKIPCPECKASNYSMYKRFVKNKFEGARGGESR
jgi:predicted Zn-ribbon and HTH transcriptional regulator